jgi:GTPase SAR1 family protein
MDLNYRTVEHTNPEFYSDGDYLMLGDNDRNRRRKTVAIYNEVEKLNKHPSIFINYLRVLVEGKGMEFVIDESSEEDDGNTVKPKNYKLASIMEADDITHDRFEELTAKKKVGKTTMEENFQVDKHFMQKHLSVKELDEATVKEHMFNPDLLKNFLSLIDMSNYQKQDNVKSVNHVER